MSSSEFLLKNDDNYYYPRALIKRLIRRIFTIKNTGDMALTVSEISLSRYGCNHQGLKIMNCNGFVIKSGGTHSIEISWMPTNDSTVEFDRKLLVYGENQIYEFRLELRGVEGFQLDVLTSKMAGLRRGGWGWALMIGLWLVFAILNWRVVILGRIVHKKNPISIDALCRWEGRESELNLEEISSLQKCINDENHKRVTERNLKIKKHLDFKNLIGSSWTPGQNLDSSPMASRKNSDTTPRNIDTNQGPIIASPVIEKTQIQEDKNQRSATKGESAKKDRDLEKENGRIEKVALERLEKDRLRKAKLDKQAKLDLEKKVKLESEKKTQEAAQLKELDNKRELQVKREVERQQEVLRQKTLQQETKANLAEQKLLREKRNKEKLA